MIANTNLRGMSGRDIGTPTLHAGNLCGRLLRLACDQQSAEESSSQLVYLGVATDGPTGLSCLAAATSGRGLA